MPEIVGEVPVGSGGHGPSTWKAPALAMARENPGCWVRCDGDHSPSGAYRWRNQHEGKGALPDGFEVKGRSAGAPEGRMFLYVRWNGETDA